RRTGSRLIAQPVQAMFDKPPAPLADRRLVHLQAGRDILVCRTFGAAEHDPSAQRERLGRAAPTGKRAQSPPFRLTENQSRQPPTRHRPLPVVPPEESDTADEIEDIVNFRFGTLER